MAARKAAKDLNDDEKAFLLRLVEAQYEIQKRGEIDPGLDPLEFFGWLVEHRVEQGQKKQCEWSGRKPLPNALRIYEPGAKVPFAKLLKELKAKLSPIYINLEQPPIDDCPSEPSPSLEAVGGRRPLDTLAEVADAIRRPATPEHGAAAADDEQVPQPADGDGEPLREYPTVRLKIAGVDAALVDQDAADFMPPEARYFTDAKFAELEVAENEQIDADLAEDIAKAERRAEARSEKSQRRFARGREMARQHRNRMEEARKKREA